MSRCSQPALASIAVSLAVAVGAIGPDAASAHAVGKPTGVFTARIGWFYNDTLDFPVSKAGPLIMHWGSCATSGGVKIAFPTGAHLYAGYNGDFSIKKPPVALLSGPPLTASDPFKADLYVGDLAKPGAKTLTVRCMGLVKGKLKTLFTGPLKTDYVRQDVNFTPSSSPVSMNLIDTFSTEPATQEVIARSCAEPGTPSVTLSSPFLSAGPDGGAEVTLAVTDELGTFSGLVTPSTGLTPAKYPTVVSCGSGRVGVGVIALH